MRSGKLRHLVQIQRQDLTGTDAAGHPVENWETVAHVFAVVEPLSGREYWQAQQVKTTVTHTVTIRYDRRFQDMTADWRVKHGSRLLNIEVVLNPMERNEELSLMCREVT